MSQKPKRLPTARQAKLQFGQKPLEELVEEPLPRVTSLPPAPSYVPSEFSSVALDDDYNIIDSTTVKAKKLRSRTSWIYKYMQDRAPLTYIFLTEDRKEE